MSSIKHSLGNLGTKFLLYPLSFATSIVIARYLGPEERGIYSYLLLLVSFLIPIVSLGFGGGIIYYTSNKKYKVEETIFSVFLIGLLLGLTLGMLLFVLWTYSLLGATGKLITYFQIIAIACSIVLSSTVFFVTRLLLGDSKFPKLNFLEIIKGISNPILLIILVWLMSLRVTGAALTLLCINSIGFVYIIHTIFKFYTPIYFFNFPFVKDAFSYGIKGWFGDMALRANVRLDQVILGAIISAKLLGIYAIAVILSELLWIIPDAIGPVLFNKIAELKRQEDQIRLTVKIHSLIFYLLLSCSLVFCLLCYYFIIPKLYGIEYIDAAIPFLILIPGTIFMNTTKVMSKLLSATGYVLNTSYIQITSSVISVILYIILIPSFNIYGAAIASSIGYFSGMLLSLYYYKSIYNQSISTFFNLRKKDVLWSIKAIRNNF